MSVQGHAPARGSDWMRAAVAAGVLLPLFFLLSGRLYDSEVPLYDSGGRIDSLPLPLSLPVCVVGILLFRKNLRYAWAAAVFILAFAAVLAMSVFSAADTAGFSARKAILAGQFLLPTLGLLLGQLLDDDEQLVPRAFFCLLSVFVPLQLLAGWLQGSLFLTHRLYGFSIYQHFQFVPVIFVAAYCWVLGSPRVTGRRSKLLLTAGMAIYAISSVSFLAIALFATGTLAYWGMQGRREKEEAGRGRNSFMPLLALILIASAVLVVAAGRGIDIRHAGGQVFGKVTALAEGKLPLNVVERLEDWSRFGSGIAENPRSVLFGHAEPLPREVRTSAHNWYLDLAYNFGTLALLPLLGLIAASVRLAWTGRAGLDSHICWLGGIVLFLVLVDANFKVMLRQPYPGLFSFFLWGLLLAKLRKLSQPGGALRRSRDKVVPPAMQEGSSRTPRTRFQVLP